MTYLEICKRLAQESGTVSGNLPVSVAGQTGRLKKIVDWAATAWEDIQNSRNAWHFMRGEFEAQTIANTNRYTAASFDIERFAEWVVEPGMLTIYKQSLGVSDEQRLHFMPWDHYKKRFEFGEQVPNRPVYYSVSPANELCFGPVPDDVYVIKGPYRKSPQVLSENGHTPDMPDRFHMVIVWHAMLYLAEHDEGQLHIAVAMRRYNTLMNDLQRDQLPRIGLSGTLA